MLAKDKEDLILNSALKLFVERGFSHTPTSLISKEAGIAIGTLFCYFKTKEDLINSVYLKCKDSMVESMERGQSESEGIMVSLGNLSEDLIRWGITNFDMLKFLLQYANSPLIDKISKKEVDRKIHFIVNKIDEGKQENLLKNISTDFIIDIVVGIAYSAVVNMKGQNSKEEQEKTIKNTVEIIMDAVKA